MEESAYRDRVIQELAAIRHTLQELTRAVQAISRPAYPYPTPYQATIDAVSRTEVPPSTSFGQNLRALVTSLPGGVEQRC